MTGILNQIFLSLQVLSTISQSPVISHQPLTTSYQVPATIGWHVKLLPGRSLDAIWAHFVPVIAP